MYDHVKANGWLKITDFDKYDTATPTFESPTLSMKELAEIREKAYKRFYLRPSYILRTLWKGGIYGIASGKGGTYGIASAKSSFGRLLRALGLRIG
jgi:hypothetical protein